MQLDGRYFLSIGSESDGKMEATVIQTVWIQASKRNVQVGIIEINSSKTYKMDSYQSMPTCLPLLHIVSWSTHSSHLFHPDHCAWLAGDSE
jgi:hypothetical protein